MAADPREARWDSVRELFFEALELPAAAREDFVRERSGDDAALRDELRSLLEAHGDGDGALETLQRGEVRRSLEDVLVRGMRGVCIGPWSLQRVIASGGMGIVYEARHREDGRIAALKVLRGGARSESALRRFRDEAEILARLRHPAIARVFEAGGHRVDDGGGPHELPYFAMEFVPAARDLLSAARDRDLDRRARIELFVEVCDAVHHAHQRGVIHRDLKADNVLVGEDGRPKVVDFGIARLEGDATRFTRTGQLLGTLRSMSPEQFGGEPHDIDVRTDVYSLGLLLYELLLHAPPHELEGRAAHEVARIVMEEEVRRPLAVDPELPVELDWILRRALEKERRRRYASVAHLQSDAQRFLDGDAVEAGPPSAASVLRRFVARHRLQVAAVAAVVLALVAGTALMAFGLRQAIAERRLADAAAAEADEQRRRAQVQAEAAVAVQEFLADVMSAASLGNRGPDLRLEDAVKAASQTVVERFADQPLVEASVHRTVGRAWLQLGFHREAEPHLRRALELRIEQGAAALELEDSRLDLGVFLREDFRAGEALELLDACCEERERRHGARAPRTMNARFHRAITWARLGRVREAEAVLGEVWQDRRDREGPRAAATLEALGHWGQSLAELDQVDRALEQWRAALEPPVPADVSARRARLDLRRRLANLYRSTEQRELAIEQSLLQIAEWRALEGPGSRAIGVELRQLARDHERAGQLGSALLQLRAALQHGIQHRGPEALFTLETRLDLALLLGRSGDPRTALGEALQARDGLRRVVPDDHPAMRRAEETVQLLTTR